MSADRRLQDVAAGDGGAVRGPAAVAVLDPPRTGLSPSVCRALRASSAVGGVVFVSCNPHGHTLRRDFVLRGGNLAANARILCARGPTPPFRLCAAVPVDVSRRHPNPCPAPIGSKAHPPLPRTCASASSSGTRHIASWCSPSNDAWSARRRSNNRLLRRGPPLFVIEFENDRARGFRSQMVSRVRRLHSGVRYSSYDQVIIPYMTNLAARVFLC